MRNRAWNEGMIARILLFCVWLLAVASYGYLLFGVGEELKYAAGGALPFDLRPQGYSLSDALEYLRVLGEPGREIYRTKILPVDTIWPTAFAIAAIWSLVLLARRAGRRARFTLLPALFYMIADHWENQMILGLMNADPAEITAPQISILVTVTQIKFGFFALAALILIRALFRRRA